MSLTVKCEHGELGYCRRCEIKSVSRYSMYGRRCWVCGEITGLQESDACFDHKDVVRPAQPPEGR